MNDVFIYNYIPTVRLIFQWVCPEMPDGGLEVGEGHLSYAT